VVGKLFPQLVGDALELVARACTRETMMKNAIQKDGIEDSESGLEGLNTGFENRHQFFKTDGGFGKRQRTKKHDATRGKNACFQ